MTRILSLLDDAFHSSVLTLQHLHMADVAVEAYGRLGSPTYRYHEWTKLAHPQLLGCRLCGSVRAIWSDLDGLCA